MGSAMASMPHYMSSGVNELAATGVEKAVTGLMTMLQMTVTGVEELVVFYINMLTSTYLCLITLAVSGSLHVALRIVEDVTGFLNSTIKDITSGLHKDIDGFQNSLNDFLGHLNGIPKFFGGDKGDIPTLDVSSKLDGLDNIHLPATLNQGLNKLNSSIPTFSDVQNFADNAIRLPFEEVKKLMNASFGKFTFNRSVFPVPQKEEVKFCSDNNGISAFFDDLAGVANLARRVFTGVLVVLAILACVLAAWMEIRRWRTMQERAQLINKGDHEPLDVMYIVSRPYTATAGIKAGSKFGSKKQQILARWFVAYGTSTPALLVLSLGLTGLFACFCQYILLKVIEKEVPQLADEVGHFADKVIKTLNNASAQWALGTNHAITSTNHDINQNVFGWVNTTTGAINHTLNVFVDQTTKVLNDTFGGTILNDPIQGVFNCLIGLKIAAIEKGLTWVSDHAHVDFPLFANDTFSVGAAASIAKGNKNSGESFLAAPGSQATDKITSAVAKVTSHLEDSIRTEAIISTCIILVWLIVVLMGLARAAFLACRREKTRGEGGPSSAGDIPLTETARPYSRAAPAYEPRAAPAPPNLPRYDDPPETLRHDPLREDDWQDQKLGYAGERPPVQEIHQGYPRYSSYGHVEKS